MSNRLPTIRTREMARLLEQLGFVLERQRGSHAFYFHPDRRRTMIPMHSGDLPRGIMKQILKDIQMSEDEFLQCLKK